MVLVYLQFCLKQTFLKPWQWIVATSVCTLFTGLIWPWSIEQSRNQIAEWLADQPLMLDTSVVLSLEALWQMSFCLLAGRLMYDGQVKRRTVWLYRVLRFFPGILILAVLYSAQVSLIYMLPGTAFGTVAWSMAIAVAVLLPSISWLLRWLLPERDLRLEVLFLSSALLLILGIVATVNGTTNFRGRDDVDWLALAADIALTLTCAAAGFLIWRYRSSKSIGK